MRIRRARLDDVDGMLALKRSLTFTGSAAGGFLLGTDAAGYRQRIEEGRTWILDDDGVIGVAIVLPDGPFRRSELWDRRHHVRWGVDPSPWIDGRLGYYDQLGVARGRSRRWGSALAFTAVYDLMHTVDHLVTATVSAPVENLAAVPYLERLGGARVGRIDEVYPDFGPLVSDLWLVDGAEYRARIARPRGLAERWLLETARAATG